MSSFLAFGLALLLDKNILFGKVNVVTRGVLSAGHADECIYELDGCIGVAQELEVLSEFHD